MIKKITTFILLSSLIFTQFIVSADIYLDDEVYIIDFSDDNYTQDDFPLLLDLGEKLIDYFKVEYGTIKTITDTDFIDTNFNKLSIDIYNEYYEPDDAYLTGFILTGYIGIDTYEFKALATQYTVILTQDNISDKYVNFSFLVPPPPPPPPLFNDTTLSITLLILLVLSLGMYLIFKSNLILLPTIILWLVFIGNTNNDLIVLFATTLFVITIVITFFKDKKGDNW